MTRPLPTAVAATIPVVSGVCLSPRTAEASTVATNLDNAEVFFSSLPSNHRAASAFTTDAIGGTLLSATLRIFANTQSTDSATFVLSLFDDNLGAPGTLITAFDNTENVSGSTRQDITFFTNTVLAPDTSYWLSLAVTGPIFGGWSGTTGAGTGPWSIDGSNFNVNGGASWGPFDTSGANQFSLDATPIPEPSTLALFAIGLAGIVGARRRKGA